MPGKQWVLAYCSDPDTVIYSADEPICFTYADSLWVNIRVSRSKGFCFTNQDTIDANPGAFTFIDGERAEMSQFNPLFLTIDVVDPQIMLVDTDTECSVGTATWQDGYNVTPSIPELTTSFELRDIETDEHGVSRGTVWYIFGTIENNNILLSATLTSVEQKLRPIQQTRSFTIAYKNEPPILKTTQFSVNYLGNDQVIDIDVVNNPHGYEIDWVMNATNNFTLSPSKLTVSGGTSAGKYALPVTIRNMGFGGSFDKETTTTVDIAVVYNTTPLYIFGTENPEYINDDGGSTDFTLFSKICVSSFSSSTVYTFTDADSNSYRLMWNPDLRETLVLMSSTDEIIATTRQKLRLHETYWLTIDLTLDHMSVYLNDAQTPQFSAPIEVLNHPRTSAISKIRTHTHDTTRVSNPTLYRIKPLAEKCMYQNREPFRAPAGFSSSPIVYLDIGGSELDDVADHRYTMMEAITHPMVAFAKTHVVTFYIVSDDNVWTGRSVLTTRHGENHHNFSIDKTYFSEERVIFDSASNATLYFGEYAHESEKVFFPTHYPKLHESVSQNNFATEIASYKAMNFNINYRTLSKFRLMFAYESISYTPKIGLQCRENYEELRKRLRRRQHNTGEITNIGGDIVSLSDPQYFNCWIVLSNNHVIELIAIVVDDVTANKSITLHCVYPNGEEYKFDDYLNNAIMYYGELKNIRLPDNIKLKYDLPEVGSLSRFGMPFSIHFNLSWLWNYDVRRYLTIMQAYGEDSDGQRSANCTINQNGEELTLRLGTHDLSSSHLHILFNSDDVTDAIRDQLQRFYNNYQGLSHNTKYKFYFRNTEYFLYHYTGTPDMTIPDLEPGTRMRAEPYPPESNTPIHHYHIYHNSWPVSGIQITDPAPIYAIPTSVWDSGSVVTNTDFAGATIFNKLSNMTDTHMYKIVSNEDLYLWADPDQTDIWIETVAPDATI